MVKQFTKPALSLDEQLDLLVKRGLKIDDRTWAKGHLRRIGYDRLSAYGRRYNTTIRHGYHSISSSPAAPSASLSASTISTNSRATNCPG